MLDCICSSGIEKFECPFALLKGLKFLRQLRQPDGAEKSHMYYPKQVLVIHSLLISAFYFVDKFTLIFVPNT